MSIEDQEKAILAAVSSASQTSEKVLDRMSEMETTLREQSDRQKSTNTRLDTMNDRIGTMNAHLENIAREVSKTSFILGEEAEARKAREEHERAMQLKELEHRVETEKDSREAFQSGIRAVWDAVKKPIGVVLTALSSFVAYHFFTTGGM